MNTNNTNTRTKLILPELSYQVCGLCYETHNELGRYSREKQYGDSLENKFKLAGISYERELRIEGTGNIADFVLEGKILLELKVKDAIDRDDYYQVQRYLQALNIPLGIIINFRTKYIRPKRVVKIETDNAAKFKD